MKLVIKILIVAFLFPLVVLSQREERPKYSPGREKHRNKTDELGQRQGVWKYYNEASELTNEIEYLDDVRNGVSKKYYPYGKIMEEIEYANGIKDGEFKRYFYNGQTKVEGEYLNGKKANKWTTYFSDGEIKNEGPYRSNLKNGLKIAGA